MADRNNNKRLKAVDGISTDNVRYLDSSSSDPIDVFRNGQTLRAVSRGRVLWEHSTEFNTVTHTFYDSAENPAIEIASDLNVRLARSGGIVLIGTDTVDGAAKLQVTGQTKVTGGLEVTGSIDGTLTGSYSGFDSDFNAKSTTDLTEGSNLYYTSARADSAARNAIEVVDNGGEGSLAYNSATGQITYTGATYAGQSGVNFDSGTSVFSAVPGEIDHDQLLNFVSNEHIDHSSVTITAGTGLSGGGTITESRTINIANTGVVAGVYGSANNIPVVTVNAQGQVDSIGTAVIADAFDGTLSFANPLRFLEDSSNGSNYIQLNGVASLTSNVSFTLPSADGSTDDFLTTNGSGVLSFINIGTIVDSDYVNSRSNAGASGTSSTLYKFDNGTDATPGSGKFQFNSGDPTSATSVIFSHFNDAGKNIRNLLLNLPLRGSKLYVQRDKESDEFALFTVTDNPTSNDGDETVTLSVDLDSETGDAFANNKVYGWVLQGVSDTNVFAGQSGVDFDSASGVISAVPGEIDHDQLLNFVSDEHIDHSSVTLTAGDGLTGGGTITESRTFKVDSASIATLGTEQTFSANKTFGGDVEVQGNLSVLGTTTTINTENLSIADNLIYLNSEDSAGSPTVTLDLGFVANYNDDGVFARAGLFRDATDNKWTFFEGYTPDPSDSAQIDTNHVSFSLAALQARTIEGKYLGFDSDFGGKTTADLTENTNLYYTTARANSAIDARVTKAFVDALDVDADTLDTISSESFLRSDTTDEFTAGTLTFNNTASVNFNKTTGTSPFNVVSTTVVTNLNADTVDGFQGIGIYDSAGTLLN